MNLRIELDKRDGFIYVREKVNHQWKQIFRATTIDQVFDKLSAKFKGTDNAEHSEVGDGSSNSLESVVVVQS